MDQQECGQTQLISARSDSSVLQIVRFYPGSCPKILGYTTLTTASSKVGKSKINTTNAWSPIPPSLQFLVQKFAGRAARRDPPLGTQRSFSVYFFTFCALELCLKVCMLGYEGR